MLQAVGELEPDLPITYRIHRCKGGHECESRSFALRRILSASRPHFGQSSSVYCFPVADARHGYSGQAETQWKFSNMIGQHKTIVMEFGCQSRSEAVSWPRNKSGREVDFNQNLLSDNIAHRKSYRQGWLLSH